jgi:methylglutaconyl-CoA hydratase
LENAVDSRLLQETFHAIYTFPKPVIAKVHGAAIAGGCGLSTVCDFVVGGREKSLFGYSEVKIGFIPAVVMVYLLKKIGDTRSRKLLLSAENISATEAERIGLITHVCDDAELDNFTNELALKLAANSASSMMLTKEMLNNLHGMSLDSGLRYAASMNAFTRMTDDCKAGIASFLKQ